MQASSTLKAPDGVSLALYSWPVASPRGIVVLVHGLGEHMGRYAHVARHLNSAGWSFLGFDNRGHGLSQGPRGGMRTGEDYLRDTALVVDHARALVPHGPLILIGHSLGGLIAGRFAASHAQPHPSSWKRQIDGLVMSSPALDPGLSGFQKFLMATVSRWFPDVAAPNGLKPEWISRDAAVVQAYVDDPLVHGKITGRVATFIVEAGEETRSLAANWSLPTLLVYAGSDLCVAPRGSDAFAGAAPAQAVTAQRFDSLYHEIFNEPEQRTVLDAVTRWLDEHFARA